MLTQIGIGNFKAFGDKQHIPIRPLTLIYGANSSGKSSILHSLIFARHAQETGNFDIHRTTIGGESVDLGGFRQFIHRRNVDRRMQLMVELNTASFTGQFAELMARVKSITATLEIGLPQVEEMIEQDSVDPRSGDKIRIKVPTGNLIPTGNPEVLSYEIGGDGNQLLQMSKRTDGKLQLDRLDLEHPLFREVVKAIVETSTTSEAIKPSDFDGLDDAISDIVPEIFAKAGKFMPEGLIKSDDLRETGQLSLFPVSRGRRKEDLAAAVRFFIPRKLDDLLKGLMNSIQNEINRLQYLGPLRSYPPRHLAFSQHQDPNWFSGGGYAWDVVRDDANVRVLVNAWLSAEGRLQTPYELVLRDLVAIDQLEDPLLDGIELINAEGLDMEPDYDDEPTPTGAYPVIKDPEAEAIRLRDIIRSSNIDKLNELIVIDRRSNTIVSHRDIGIGVSQVLPVLVGAYASKHQIIAIEQPEIHLHPALQGDLADVFIQSALGESKNRFLIETHSEHLLLRVMRRIRETTAGKLPEGVNPIYPNDVMVLFVEPKGQSSVIHQMPLNKSGELTKEWPGGFFEEDFEELF